MKPYATTKHTRSRGNCRKGKPKKTAHRTARRLPKGYCGNPWPWSHRQLPEEP